MLLTLLWRYCGTKKQDEVDETIPRRIENKREALYDFPESASVFDYLNYFGALIQKHGNDARFMIDHDRYGYGDSCDCSLDFRLITFRDETEKEIAKRIERALNAKINAANAKIAKEKKAKADLLRAEGEERALYLMLKKKYDI